MANKKLTELPTSNNPPSESCLTYVVDQTDTTDGPYGTSKQVNVRTLVENIVPSTTELSVSGALQSYIDYCLSKTGHVKLPPGIITLPAADEIVLYRTIGGVIEGAGRPHEISTGTNGWVNVTGGDRAYTLIRKLSGGTKQIFRMEPAINVTFQNFGIENPSHDGFKLVGVSGWGGGHIFMNNVSGMSLKKFFTASGALNAADVVFTGIQLRNCAIGLEVNHQQGVNWLFDGQCYLYNVDIAVLLRNGGYVHLDNTCGFGVKTWVRADTGGPNLMPTCRITNLYSDRTPPDSPPVIVDFSRATDYTAAIIDGFRVTDNSVDTPNSGHSMFLTPTGVSGASSYSYPSGTFRSGITIRDIDFMRFPRIFNATPTGLANPYGDQGYPKT